MKKERNEKEIGGVLQTIERVGNALPHPAIIFVILSVVLVIIAEIISRAGITVDYYDARAHEQVQLGAVSLLNAEGLRYIFNSATKNFTGFAPLGTVLVAMLGVGVAEYTGLFNTSLRKLLSGVPMGIVTPTIVFAGVMSNIASDAGYVVVIPLGALIFASMGRHPVAGLAAAFAGVSGGFSANLLLGTLDPLLQGITNEALHAASIDLAIDPTANWYFMIVSTFIIVAVATVVTNKIVIPNLGPYHGDYVHEDAPITELENKGLKNAGLALLVFLVLMGLAMFLPNAPLKAPDANGDLVITGFISNGLIFAMFLAFFIPGLAYGKTIGVINNSNDLIATMTKSMQSMGGYLVLAFFASQFVAYFSHTNLGIILSVKGAEFLKAIGLSGIPLITVFILLCAFINLFMGSASAKWAIMAPIFVPMMYHMGISPALTQVAYRIGDSTTNIISPLMSYFAMIVVFMQRYDKEKGLGTLISTMVPYSISFLITWTLLLIIWMFIGLPLGPGAALYI
ncbi:MAG: AbgT family transporter [Tissierellia bacterium]|nr:AbgT family transporter [Tissierellia bacterium]